MTSLRWFAAAVVAALAACSSPWVASSDAPASVTTFSFGVKTYRIEKADLVFAIDDSPSMADKEARLARELPAFLERLMAPRCEASDGPVCAVDADCAAYGTGARCDPSAPPGGRCFTASHAGVCPAQTRIEFQPIDDLHVAIVSSSLGSGGAPEACADRLGRPFDAGFASAAPRDGRGGGFLAWLPRSVPANAWKPAPNVTAYGDGEDAKLVADFTTLVGDAGASGCALEGQLESWYRFLVQPDPYASIATTADAPPRAVLAGVDTTLLAMRHDFLRPDSLVVVVQVTDEDDGWSDPLAQGGHGWFARAANFPGGPGAGLGPRGTSACDTDPTNPACGSCADPKNASDPNCTSCAGGLATCPKKGWYAPGQDSLDARYTDDMARRYGFDPQWNVQRYVDGLRAPRVPDRDHEVHDASRYTDTVKNCENPLFAGALPDGSDTSHAALCDLPAGPRTPDLVLYVLVGGVAPSLLAAGSGEITNATWPKLVGEPRDPHMIESIAPRAGIPAPFATYGLGSDPDVGRDWNAAHAGGLGDARSDVDLQFACTFPLGAPRDCTATSPCACAPGSPGATASDGPPLCDPAVRTNQVRGAAYPSIRELRVARGLGAQASVASICSPSYEPAFAAVYFRLAGDTYVDGQCLSSTLVPRPDCSTSCVALLVFPYETDQLAGCTYPGTSQPDAVTLDRFAARYRAEEGDAPVPVACVYRQLAGGVDSSVARATGCDNPRPDFQGSSCVSSGENGWCYVVGAADSGGCPQAIAFGGGGPPIGTALTFDCAQTSPP